jgi:hypothetical protein
VRSAPALLIRHRATPKRLGCADDASISLAKRAAGLIGLALLAYGITGLLFGGHGFTSHAISGTVSDRTWLSAEGNGWTNLLFVATGAVLVVASARHRGAKTAALVVACVLGTAAVISLIDGDDVLGVLAANGLTKQVWGVAAVALLAVALLPRAVGTRKPHDHDHAELRRRAADRDPVRGPIRFGRDRANVDEPWSWPRDPANPTSGSRVTDEHAGPRQQNRKA